MPEADPKPQRDAGPEPAAPEAAPSTGAGPEPAGPSREDPPGLRAQIGATRDSARRLVGAHIDLAKAEFGEVADEIKRVAALVGIAIGAAIVAGLLLTVGLPLFLGEWIFGSIGWGILHGLLLLTAIGVSAVVLALGVSMSTVGRSLGVGVLAGVIVGVVLGLNLTNRAWGLAGENLLPTSDAGPRPLATALVVLPVVSAVVAGLLGLARALRGDVAAIEFRRAEIGERVPVALPTALYVGWLAAFIYSYSSRVAWADLAIVGVGIGGFAVSLAILVIVAGWRPGFALVTGMGIGTIVGVILAGLTALGLGRRVGAAIGVTVGLSVWIGWLGAEVARHGIDGEALMKRFVPQKTIDITKETIEWARARMPLSRRS